MEQARHDDVGLAMYIGYVRGFTELAGWKRTLIASVVSLPSRHIGTMYLSRICHLVLGCICIPK
jgi:hypothetical protein